MYLTAAARSTIFTPVAAEMRSATEYEFPVPEKTKIMPPVSTAWVIKDAHWM